MTFPLAQETYKTHLRGILFRYVIGLNAALLSLFTACSDDVPIHAAPQIETDTQAQTVARARYVFLLIGDGMGAVQTRLAELYLESILDDGAKGDMVYSAFPVQTTVTTHSQDHEITDSAAAATAIATGHKTGNEIVGKDIDQEADFEPITVKIKESGYKVGIITSVSLDHGTPAGFYAHQDDRHDYYEIAMQLGNSGIDFFGGGGFRKPTGEDDDMPDAYDAAESAGYYIVRDMNALNLAISTVPKIVAVHPELLGKGDMPWAMESEYRLLPLSSITRTAISFLENPGGFFMMVEGGKIDWACHDNDAASVIHEVLAFNDAVKEAVNFYILHPDETLIVVVADHESGGLALGNADEGTTLRVGRLKYQKLPLDLLDDRLDDAVEESDSFEELMSLITSLTGLGDDDKGLSLSDDELAQFEDAYLYTIASDEEQETMEEPPTTSFARIAIDLLTQKAGVGWTSDTHTAAKVPLFALGVGQECFAAPMDNTEISVCLKQGMGINQ